MWNLADERSKFDRTETGTDAARDAREEFTMYWKEEPKTRAKDEAVREADLQAGRAKKEWSQRPRRRRSAGA